VKVLFYPMLTGYRKTVVLQSATRALLKPSQTKSPTHNELGTKRPMG